MQFKFFYMNGVDIFLIAIIILFLWLGWQKGAIAGIADLIIWIGSLVIGYFLYLPFAGFLSGQFNSIGAWSKPVAFIVLVFLSRLLLSLAFNSLLKTVPPQAHANVLNKAVGLAPGFINGIINAAIIAALLLMLPLSNAITASAENSIAADYLNGPLQWFNQKASPIFAEALSQPAAPKSIHPKTNETVSLPFKVSNSAPRQELEQQMIALVNEERAKVGLPALKYEAALTPVARQHSTDMFERGYFSHYSPEGKSVADRLKSAGVKYLSAGENLALAPTLVSAHTGLMNSPGHKANILHKAYGKIGIGIMDGGIRGLMVTQIFKN